MVVTNSPEYTRTMRMLRDWGTERKYHHELKGYNYRMEGMQGAILRVKLRHLEAWTEARRSRAALYDSALEASGLELPRAMPYSRHVYHVYAVQTPRRDELAAALQAQRIQTGIHYPIPIHLLGAWSDLNYPAGSFPVAERVAGRVLSLPMYPELPDEAIQRIAAEVRAVHASEMVG
jgi:dTDP-4-amino-4,6-dideoxygalactose transaminase